MPVFRPIHINATAEDLAGHEGRGRVVLLPGSPGRARGIAERFTDSRTIEHPRGHAVHTGRFTLGGKSVEVACVATGMGGPSVEIILSELLELGARRFIRVGTSGSLQARVHLGDLVIVTAAVRDEGAADHYLPREFPATASIEVIDALRAAATGVQLAGQVHVGVAHSKDTLYARELGRGPMQDEHARYWALLQSGGVLASEMECATVFTLAALADQAAQVAPTPGRVQAGAVLAVIGEHDAHFSESDAVGRAVEDAIAVALGAAVALG